MMIRDREYTPDLSHENILIKRKKLLAFDPCADYAAWKEKVRAKLDELLGDMPEKVEPRLNVEWEKEHEVFIERRFTFYSEYRTKVPCHLLIPKTGRAPYPVVICLQGHSSGMHVSLGRMVYPGDEESFKNGEDRECDFAIQAVGEGFAALTVEQRGFGERKTCQDHNKNALATCAHPSMVALLLGRTLLRERSWDVSRAIDVLGTFPEIDCSKIGVTGSSGGGTVSYYAACFEPRITAAMPACSVCSFSGSAGFLRHCEDNYVPGMAKYFDLPDVACLIAPRPLVVVAGRKDHGFMFTDAERAYDVIEQIYAREGVPSNCKLVVGPEGHRFYADISWKAFKEYF